VQKKTGKSRVEEEDIVVFRFERGGGCKKNLEIHQDIVVIYWWKQYWRKLVGCFFFFIVVFNPILTFFLFSAVVVFVAIRSIEKSDGFSVWIWSKKGA